jgi:hypothetical protein
VEMRRQARRSRGRRFGLWPAVCRRGPTRLLSMGPFRSEGRLIFDFRDTKAVYVSRKPLFATNPVFFVSQKARSPHIPNRCPSRVSVLLLEAAAGSSGRSRVPLPPGALSRGRSGLRLRKWSVWPATSNMMTSAALSHIPEFRVAGVGRKAVNGRVKAGGAVSPAPSGLGIILCGQFPGRCPGLACGAPLGRSKGVEPWKMHKPKFRSGNHRLQITQILRIL